MFTNQTLSWTCGGIEGSSRCFIFTADGKKYAKWGGQKFFCPKFLGLPDLIRGAIADLPEIIDVKVDLSKGLWPKWQLSRQVAQLLDKRGGYCLAGLSSGWTSTD